MSYERWEARASDVPGDRVTRSVATGLADVDDGERDDIVEKRKAALDRLRAAAKAAATEEERDAIWRLVPRIGKGEEAPDWDAVVSAHTYNDFLALAMGADRRDESDAARSQTVELRTVRQSVEAYKDYKERQGFGVNTTKNTTSVLDRAVEADDPRSDDDSRFGDRRLVTVSRSDVEPLLSEIPTTDEVSRSTRDDYRKHLKAWWNWELAREEERAEKENRNPLLTSNPFVRESSRYSSPRDGRHKTMAEVEHGRRFFPDEVEAILDEADVRSETAFLTCHRLGLRPGELIHLRWQKDVRPLDDGDGFRVDIQGGRGRDERCSCRPCGTKEGWAPKSGPRAYHLERDHDAIGWASPLIDALERWVILRDPEPGDFLFPSPADPSRAWTNQSLNRRLHRIADRLRESGRLPGFETGRDSDRRLTMHSWRHTCASEMLERGVPVPLAAEWIGDKLETFKEVYGNPTLEDVCRATLAGYGSEQGS